MKRLRTLIVLAAFCAAACDKDPARSVKIATSSPPLPAPAVTAQPSTESAQAPAVVQGPAPVQGAASVQKDAPSQSAAKPDPGTPTAAPPSRASVRAAPAKPTAKAPATPVHSSPEAKSSDAAALSPSGEQAFNGCPPPADAAGGPSTLKVTGPCPFEHRGTFAYERAVDDFYLSMTRKAARGATLTVFVNVESYKGPGTYKAAQMWIGVQDKTSIYRWSSDALDITIGPDEAYALLPDASLQAEPVLVDCTGPMTNYQCGGRDISKKMITGTVQKAAGKLMCAAADPPKTGAAKE